MQEAEFPDDGVSEMPASSAMVNSPQFNSVLEQMGDFGEKIHDGIKKKATTTCMWKSMPLIEVTCFDDEAYNKKIQNELENAPATETNEATTANEALIIGHSVAQPNNEREVNSGDNGNDEDESVKASSCVERNSWVENNTDGIQSKKTNAPRKCSKGFVASSPQSSNRTTNQTKVEINDIETKRQVAGPEELKSSEPPKTPRKPDFRQSEVLASPSARRRRYTVCSFPSDNGSSNEPQNNSVLNNRKGSVPVPVVAAQNAPRSPKLGERNLSSEILNGRKKPERIDLSFKLDSLANDSQQSKEFRKRSRTYEGKTQNPRRATSALKRSSSEEHYLPDGDFRVHHDNRRLANGNPSPGVGKSPRETFQAQESKDSLEISESGLSSLKDAGIVSRTDNRSLSTRRVSTSILHGHKSASKGFSEKQPLSQLDITQRLNLSPPRSRRVDTPKPLQDDKQSHLGVSTSPTRRKSETDLRKLVSEEEGEAEKQRQLCLTTPPRTRRGSDSKSGEKKTSLGVSGKLSLSRSETDLRTLVSDEERADARRPSLASPQRVRKLNSSKLLTTVEALCSPSSPVSPRLERKIYLAAAKPAARLPIRAKVRNDLAASSQIIIDQAEKELDQCSERLPHISMEEVMKSWHTDSRHWNVVSSLVKQNSDCASKTNMETVKNCRYIRDGVLKKKKNSH